MHHLGLSQLPSAELPPCQERTKRPSSSCMSTTETKLSFTTVWGTCKFRRQRLEAGPASTTTSATNPAAGPAATLTTADQEQQAPVPPPPPAPAAARPTWEQRLARATQLGRTGRARLIGLEDSEEEEEAPLEGLPRNRYHTLIVGHRLCRCTGICTTLEELHTHINRPYLGDVSRTIYQSFPSLRESIVYYQQYWDREPPRLQRCPLDGEPP